MTASKNTPTNYHKATYAAELRVFGSRSGGDNHYVTIVTEGGLATLTLCTCEAGKRGRTCWAQREARIAVHDAGVAKIEADREERIANGTARPEDTDPFFGLIESEVSR